MKPDCARRILFYNKDALEENLHTTSYKAAQVVLNGRSGACQSARPTELHSQLGGAASKCLVAEEHCFLLQDFHGVWPIFDARQARDFRKVRLLAVIECTDLPTHPVLQPL
jgi:hypothetical protein